MRLDAHQHFWRYDPAEHVWMDDRMTAIKRDFLPADLLPLPSATRYDGTIAVQARQDLAETRWLLELANQHWYASVSAAPAFVARICITLNTAPVVPLRRRVPSSLATSFPPR